RLEDRLALSSASFNSGTGVLTVTIAGASDNATLYGTDATQGNVTFKNHASAISTFTGVTGITVNGDSSAGQQVTFNDNGGGAQPLNISGALSSTGVKTLTFSGAAINFGSLSETGATTAVNLNTTLFAN